ncbi:SWIM zinc finger domain-containing protein [Actinomadura sp. NEAU-AAG7]|uniref:SWIM zinc finger family protein n=1 Tax=Actinomadura sp. NEAU-AAG7 TaxID=2839640 RepID=UPI001BE4929A|nr:hypothetical protein [Actinomadura sp. NEAU-AAG7]MBT2206478.1 hypothetical protein [Actinomadura sp. NEAU-AAG7]
MDRQTVTERSIQERAGSEAFNRGRVYLGQGRVEDLSVTATSATATVDGTRPYRVRLELAHSRMAAECSCPQGGESAFCKHCVAVALAWVAEAGPLPLPDAAPTPEPEPEPEPGAGDARLRAFLATRDTAWLVEELMRAAAAAPLLRSRLEVAAGAEVADVLDVERLRRRLTGAIEAAFADPDDPEDPDDLDEALAEVSELIDTGFAPTAVELTEHAIDVIVSHPDACALDEFLLSSVRRLHLRACAGGHPDPAALADRLVDQALAAGECGELFPDALPDYAEALGEPGMARYRERVAEAWEAAKAEGTDAAEAVKRLRERLAEAEGGADALIAVLTETEPSYEDLQLIVRALASEGRDTEAVAWVTRGLEEYEYGVDLRELGAECLLRAGDRRGAVAMLWPAVIQGPTLARYQALAEAAGDHWPRWRERALTLLKETVSGRDDLIEILLWEDDVDGAWRASQGIKLYESLHLRLARARGATHPADAVPVLLARADQEIARTGKYAYSRAASFLAEAQLLAEQGGEAEKERFVQHMARLRAEHKPKYSLRRYLDRARLP